MKRVRRITHGAAAVVGMVAVAMAAVSTPALAASSPSPDATTLSADTVAARRAALDTEPRPVVTDEMRALLAAKDKEATAYWNKKMATASAKKLKSAGVDVAARTAAAQGLAAGRGYVW